MCQRPRLHDAGAPLLRLGKFLQAQSFAWKDSVCVSRLGDVPQSRTHYVAEQEGRRIRLVGIRLEMARALALNPFLLLLDEPLAGLNQKEASALGDLIVQLNEKGQTILLIEHNLKEVMRICKKIYVQDNGRSLAYGEAQEVMKNEDVKRAYLGTKKNA